MGHEVRTNIVWDSVWPGCTDGADPGGVRMHAFYVVDQLLLIEVLWAVVALVFRFLCH